VNLRWRSDHVSSVLTNFRIMMAEAPVFFLFIRRFFQILQLFLRKTNYKTGIFFASNNPKLQCDPDRFVRVTTDFY